MIDIIISNIGDLIIAICGLLGIVVTSTLGYQYFRKKGKDHFCEDLFREYEKRSQELAMILRDLLSLSFVPSNYSDTQLEAIAKELSLFYFKYYLTLPTPVLHEIQCLFICLHYKGKHLYSYDRDLSGNDILIALKGEKEQEFMIKESSLMLRVDEEVIRRFYHIHKDKLSDTFLKIKARHVITIMHDSWNIDNIHEWKNILTKETIAQKEYRLSIAHNIVTQK